MSMRSCLNCKTDFYTSMYASYCSICQAQEANQKAADRAASRMQEQADAVASQQRRLAEALSQAQADREWESYQQQEAHNRRMAALEERRIAAMLAQTEQIRRNGLTPEERAEEDRIAALRRAQAKYYASLGQSEAFKQCSAIDDWDQVSEEYQREWVSRTQKILDDITAEEAEHNRKFREQWQEQQDREARNLRSLHTIRKLINWSNVAAAVGAMYVAFTHQLSLGTGLKIGIAIAVTTWAFHAINRRVHNLSYN